MKVSSFEKLQASRHVDWQRGSLPSEKIWGVKITNISWSFLKMFQVRVRQKEVG